MEHAFRYIKLGDQSVAISFSAQLVPGPQFKIFTGDYPDPVCSSAVYVDILGEPYEIICHRVSVFGQKHIFVTTDLNGVIRQVHSQEKSFQCLIFVSLAKRYAH